ncbi:MAG: hypothetical protein VX612_01050, partial [Pseudomonadota bacterium]|nr:hypothetical protein [Pseudomonadota bacterium]
MAHELEMRVGQQIGDIIPGTGEKIIDAQHILTARQQALAQMAADKTRAAGYQNAFAITANVYYYLPSPAAKRLWLATLRVRDLGLHDLVKQ